MDENQRGEKTVPTAVHDGEGKKAVYVSKSRGLPGFSGRSTRTIHAACDRARSGAKVGQQKQIK